MTDKKITSPQLTFLTSAYVFGGLFIYETKSVPAVMLFTILTFAGALPAALAAGNPTSAVRYLTEGRVKIILAALTAYPLMRDLISLSVFSSSVYVAAQPKIFLLVLIAVSLLLAPHIRVTARLSELLPLPAFLCAAVCLFGKWEPALNFAIGREILFPSGTLSVPLLLPLLTITGTAGATPALAARTDKKISPRAKILLSSLSGAVFGGVLYIFISSFRLAYGNIAEYFLVCFAALIRISATIFTVMHLCRGKYGKYVAVAFSAAAAASAYPAATVSGEVVAPLLFSANLLVLLYSVVRVLDVKRVR